MSSLLLALNAGSSSLKFALFDHDTLVCRYRGDAEDAAGERRFSVAAVDDSITERRELVDGDFSRAALGALVDWLREQRLDERLAAAGHRVVHGGDRFTAPIRVDDDSLAHMESLVRLAPLHLPRNLHAIRELRALLPGLPQVACFDTMFHAGQERLVRTYGLPAELTASGYLRYGFHGLSYEYVASRLDALVGDAAGGRVIVAHLGNGASLCALNAGRSVATTLGYSTLDGLVMGTRCGPLDPGIVLDLVREHGGDVDAVERILYHDSGLEGISGISNDMRVLLEDADPRARFAVDLFVYRIVRAAGSLAAALGGLDALVFTGGIGARAAPIRERVCAGLEWLGVHLDAGRNRDDESRLEQAGARVAVACCATDEEAVIAGHTRSVAGA